MKSTKKTNHIILKILAIISAAIILFVIGVNLFICLSTRGKICDTAEVDFEDADCILVLGAGVRDDGSPSHMLEDRLLTGIALYKNSTCDTLLMSGDHGREGYDEVNTMKSFAVANGVDADRIFMDHAGFSTYDSLYRARDVFGAKKVIIVTQEYHLYRALAIADSLGLEAVGVPADLRTYSGQMSREVREIAARVKDFFYIIFKPDPVYLGEPISLTGSGEVTNG